MPTDSVQTRPSTYTDVLLTTQNLGKTSVDELSSSIGKVIPLAAAYGVTVENLSSGLAVMTANGIATAEATTYTKSMSSTNLAMPVLLSAKFCRNGYRHRASLS
ncbi:phage tail tape measure protein [Faecalibacterium sp. 9]|uniref:phage tail tape measure protein n=1 Tax=Faecalibacterium sp. 9 TaxID=3402018 RepID=UPI003AAE9F7E